MSNPYSVTHWKSTKSHYINMNIDQNELAEIRRMVSTLPPFTITITDPREADYLISALITQRGGSKEAGNLLSMALGVSVRMLGVEAGVDAWINAANETQERQLPKFTKPLLIHYFEHIKRQVNEGQEGQGEQ